MNEPVFEVKSEFIEEEPTTAAAALVTSPAKRKNSFRWVNWVFKKISNFLISGRQY